MGGKILNNLFKPNLSLDLPPVVSPAPWKMSHGSKKLYLLSLGIQPSKGSRDFRRGIHTTGKIYNPKLLLLLFQQHIFSQILSTPGNSSLQIIFGPTTPGIWYRRCYWKWKRKFRHKQDLLSFLPIYISRRDVARRKIHLKSDISLLRPEVFSS